MNTINTTTNPASIYAPATALATAAPKAAQNAAAPPEEPAAIVTLSEEAQNWSDSQKISYTAEELRAGEKLSLNLSAEEIAEIKKDSKFWTQKDEVETFFKDKLRGKVESFREISAEIGKLLSSYEKENGATLEERAANREAGLKLAEHVANAYLSDPDEIKSFMEMANKAVESDEWREKGYYVSDMKREERFRPEPKAVEVDPSIKKYDDEGKWTMEWVKAYFEGYWSKFGKGGEKYEAWRAQKGREFDENAKRVGETITNAKASFNHELIADSLKKIKEMLGL